MRNPEGKKIILELNEHDAAQILALVKKELTSTADIWQVYWETLAKNIEQAIIQASLTHHNSSYEDTFNSDEVRAKVGKPY